MRRALPLLTLLCLAFAPAPPYRPKPDRSKEDLQKLQGAWRRVRITIDGEAHSEVGRETTILIAEDRMKYAVVGKPTNEWVFSLDGKARPPRLDRQGIKGAANGLTYLGVYRLAGDGFVLCSREGARPADFGGAGAGVYVEVYERVKP
jgi:uncharacterized protein (TIGR03067 family)